MVIVYFAPELHRLGLDACDRQSHLLDAGNAAYPARAELGGALDRRLAGAAYPQRQGLLHRPWRDSGVLVLKIASFESHRFFVPQARYQCKHFVGNRAAMFGAAAGGGPLGGLWVADAEHRQQAAITQEVDSRALLGQHQRIAQRHDDGVHTELDFLGAAGK